MRSCSARLSSDWAFEPRPHPPENRVPIAQPKSRTSVRQTERVLLRTTFAHALCASSLPHIAVVYLGLGHCARSFPVQHQRGCPVLHQRGSKWRERPPPFAHFVRLCPPDAMRITWASAALPTGGRSRHNDPCGKVRIAEG